MMRTGEAGSTAVSIAPRELVGAIESSDLGESAARANELDCRVDLWVNEFSQRSRCMLREGPSVRFVGAMAAHVILETEKHFAGSSFSLALHGRARGL